MICQNNWINSSSRPAPHTTTWSGAHHVTRESIDTLNSSDSNFIKVLKNPSDLIFQSCIVADLEYSQHRLSESSNRIVAVPDLRRVPFQGQIALVHYSTTIWCCIKSWPAWGMPILAVSRASLLGNVTYLKIPEYNLTQNALNKDKLLLTERHTWGYGIGLPRTSPLATLDYQIAWPANTI